MIVRPNERVTLLRRLLKDFGVRILYWDLESSPNEAYVWSTGEQYVSHKQIKEGKETKIITIQYMWEGDPEPSYLVWDKTEDGFDDSAMIEYFITKVLYAEDPENLIVVGQNHKAFDHKLLNERAKALRLTPPIHDMIKIDTYRLHRSSFKAASHSLDARSKQYQLGGKIQTDLTTWTNILEGVTTAEDELIPYGLKDVTDLRSIMWNDLPYYEKLPAQLERLLVKARAKCENCETNKKSKYNLEECKVNGKKGFMCLNCGERFT